MKCYTLSEQRGFLESCQVGDKFFIDSSETSYYKLASNQSMLFSNDYGPLLVVVVEYFGKLWPMPVSTLMDKKRKGAPFVPGWFQLQCSCKNHRHTPERLTEAPSPSSKMKRITIHIED